MDDDLVDLDSFEMCAIADYGEKEELLRYLNQVKKIERPDEVRNQIVDIDENQPFESGVWFGKSGEGDPTNSDRNYFSVDAWEETALEDVDWNMIHIHASFDQSMRRGFEEILHSVLEIVGEVDVRYVTTRMDFDKTFDEFDFPEMGEEDGGAITGLQIEIGDRNYTIQGLDDYVFINVQNTGYSHISHSDVSNFLAAETEKIEDTLLNYTNER